MDAGGPIVWLPGKDRLAHDRKLARAQSVVSTTLLEFGGMGTKATVRFGNEAIMLDHGLCWETFRNLGDNVPVVEDPEFPWPLIPTEIAADRGVLGLLWDSAPMIIAWIAIVGFLGWLLIPRELAALGEAIDGSLRRGRTKPRH